MIGLVVTYLFRVVALKCAPMEGTESGYLFGGGKCCVVIGAQLFPSVIPLNSKGISSHKSVRHDW
jgi:hypothetical protein